MQNEPVNPIQYLSIVGYKTQLLLNHIRSLKQDRTASQGSLALADTLIRLLSRTYRELGRLASKVDELESFDIIAKARLLHDSTVIIIQPLIEAISSAKVDTPVNGVIDAFTSICSQAQFGTQFTMYPKWEYNASYREVMSVLRSIASNISVTDHHGILDGAHPYHVIVTYPASIDDIPLHQCVIAHEVGHFVDFVRGWSKDVLEANLIPKNIRYEFASLSHDERLVLNELAKPWIREIVADTIATCILGPAYVCALEEIMFVAPNDPSIAGAYSSSHPPKEFRLSFVASLCLRSQLIQVKSLQEFTYLTAYELQIYEKIVADMEVKAQHDIQAYQRIRDQRGISSDKARSILKILLAILNNSAQLIDQKIKDTLTEAWTCSPIDILHGIVLQENYHHFLTPTQYSGRLDRHPSFASVMNSGWFYLIDNSKDFVLFQQNGEAPIPEEFRSRYMIIQHLVAKGIETLNFQKEYERRRRHS